MYLSNARADDAELSMLEKQVLRASETNPRSSELEVAFKDNRAEAISLLWQLQKQEKQIGQYLVSEERIFNLLLKLGDPPAMRAVVDHTFGDYENWAATGFKFMFFIGPGEIGPLPRSRVVRERTRQIHSRPQSFRSRGRRSIFATDLIAAILANSEAVLPNVSDWAKGLDLFEECRAPNREILRNWWRTNQKAFDTGDFAKIVPGEKWAKGPPLVSLGNTDPMTGETIPKTPTESPAGAVLTTSNGSDSAEASGGKGGAASSSGKVTVSFTALLSVVVASVLCWHLARGKKSA